ncbi:MAG: hypothetical protein JEZ08_17970 [Clostridiales bacterium]|nr:hypothetical protein [Clostridiales bacterium]
MKSWEKPVLSVLGVDKTKGRSVFKVLSGVPLFENETTEITGEEFVSAEGYKGNCDCSRPGNHYGNCDG